MTVESDISQLKTKMAKLEANTEAHNLAVVSFAAELRALNQRLLEYMGDTVELERSTRNRFESIESIVAKAREEELEAEAAELRAKILKLEARPESLIRWVGMVLGIVTAFYSAVRAYRGYSEAQAPHQIETRQR